MSDMPIPPEVLHEYVEDECPTCGAYMLNPALHAEWHKRVMVAGGRLRDRLDSIVDPHTRYGG